MSTLRSEQQGGSSPYFTMGAAVLQPAAIIAARKLIENLQQDFKKTKRWRHATDLNHSQKLHFCREVAKLHIRFFGVISFKPTLGSYAQDIDWEPDKFYNKCAKYLLERVGGYLSQIDSNLVEPRIVFEKRNHNYDAMIRYLTRVKENPIYPESTALNAINPFAITKKTKDEEDLLRIADLVAHALYSCVNKTPDNFSITEPRYLKELSPRFAADHKGIIMGCGVKPIHKISDLNLDEATRIEMVGLRANPMPNRKAS